MGLRLTMYQVLHKLLWGALRLLIYVKRFVVWSFGWGLKITSSLATAYRQTIGFRLYKVWFVLGKRWQPLRLALSGRFIDAVGTRGVLQGLLFALIVFITLPHSQLYTRTSATVAGQDTLLYALMGPGATDVEIEDIQSEDTMSLAVGNTWRDGVVSVNIFGNTGPEQYIGPQEISGIATGGSALTKPTIISGQPTTLLPAVERTEVVNYVVQPGDVIGAIAARYGVSINTILWANNLTERSYIRPGDVLKILPVSGLTHVVKKGDTVGKIAALYRTENEVIIDANNLSEDGRDLIVGEELIVPDGVRPQPVQTATVRRNPSFNAVAAPAPSINAPAGSNYIWPAGVKYISQYFGVKHTGIDIAGPVGTPLYAAAAGTVIKSQCGYNGGYGCHVIVDHGGGVNTLYGHASQLLVAVGEEVTQGQTIALMGSTGRSTGPHVHFEVRINKKFQNPLQYVR